MFRRTVSHGNKLGSWKTRPRSAFAPLITSPPTRSSPELGKSSPAISRSRVDFPHALGPVMEKSSPAATENETSSYASVRLFSRSPPFAILATEYKRAAKSLVTLVTCNEEPSLTTPLARVAPILLRLFARRARDHAA